MITNIIYKTNPSVIHCPGPVPTRLFRRIRAEIINLKDSEIKPVPDLTVITWSNYKAITLLEQSAKKFGQPLTILGKEIAAWSNPIKLKLTAEALQSIETPFVAGLDSRDVLICRPLNEALNTFKQLDKEILFNATPHNWPNDVDPDFENGFGGNHVNKYLNAGCWIARTDSAKEIFNRAANMAPLHRSWIKSEQAYLRYLFKDLYPQISLDYESQIFQVMSRFSEIRTISINNQLP